MSVADQINRIKTNIANTYTAAQAKGATMPQAQNSDNLAACVQSITTGGGGGTQFGLTAEQMLGTLDGEGNLTVPTLPSITFTGLKSIPANGFYYKFYHRSFEEGSIIEFPDLVSAPSQSIMNCFGYCEGIIGATFPVLSTVISDGFGSAFTGCKSLKYLYMPSLVSITENGLNNVCSGCNSLESIDFSALESIGGYGLQSAFYGSILKNVTFPSLLEVGDNSFYSAFSDCKELTTISFPSLTSVQTNSFGTSTYSYCFYGCTGLTEIHFRADMQATIEALTGYADKWGATSSTIYFDL